MSCPEKNSDFSEVQIGGTVKVEIKSVTIGGLVAYTQETYDKILAMLDFESKHVTMYEDAAKPYQRIASQIASLGKEKER